MSEKSKKNLIKENYAFVVAALICAAVIGYVLYQNKNLVDVKKYEPNEDIIRLESKIDALERKIESLENSVSLVDVEDIISLNKKIDQIHQINVQALNAKVEASTVIALVEKVNRMENDINDLSKTTSRGALILTAAALTENAAKTGHPFIYEASVLQDLSEGTRMQKSADIIASYAIKGLMNKDELIKRFNTLYKEAFGKSVNISEKKNDTKKFENWKDKVLYKLSTLIVIEKVTDDEKIEEEYMKDAVYALVQQGRFEEAILKMNNEPKYQTEAFEIWIDQTRAKDNFVEQLNKIKAQTLALIKSSDLEEKTKE